MNTNYLPPNLRWPGRNNFRSYVAALIFFLNGIRIQHRMYGGLIHESYRVQAYNELIDHQKRANVSQEAYRNALDGFNERYADQTYITSAQATVNFLMMDKIGYNASYKVTMEFNLSDMPLQNNNRSVELARVEVRMLMPALEPFSLDGDIPEYNLVVYAPGEEKVVEQKIWLPLNDSKWVSFSSRNLLEAVKTATRFTDDTPFKIIITGLLAPPESAFMNFYMDGYPEYCRENGNDESDRNCKDYVEHPIDCDAQAEESECCRTSIPFDSEEINQFGFDIQLLTQIIMAPARLNYTFCGRLEPVKEFFKECNPNKFEHKLIVTPNWWYPSEKITEDVVGNFTVTDCTCPSCLSF